VFYISFTEIVNAQDTIIKPDSSNKIKNDTIKKTSKNSDFTLSSKVAYKATDSIRFDIKEEKAYLYGKAEINYEDINLTANYIEISFKDNQLFARGVIDSTGKLCGKPVFKQGAESFTSTTLIYNFKTKKGLISGIFTKEGDSYLQGKTVKKFADNSINVKRGFYTTCDLEHPHYEIKFSKARVIPNDKIVSGPAYLVLEDVPTPIAVPFGFFPNKQGQKSGILIPAYGESAARGFFLSNGGYYFGMGDYMDLALRGDIYSRGSWRLAPAFNYKERYKYSGSFNFNYSATIDGEKGIEGYKKTNDFSVNWSHHQDSKAHPNSTFSASVNAESPDYSNNNLTSSQGFLTNQLSSSISYATVIDNNYNFQLNMSHSQSKLTHDISLNLPEIAFSVNSFNPFKNKENVGKEKWYDKISMVYSMDAKNSINTKDSLLFKKETLKQMQNGVFHNIKMQSPVKVLKYFTWTNSVTYNERWYLQTIRKHWVNDTLISGGDTTYHNLKTDTVQGFQAEHDFSFSSSLTTMIYGMYQFKNCKIIAIRHVMTPSITFTYTPDFGNPTWNYYRYNTIQSGTNERTLRYYSIFDNGIYGAPPSNKSGVINLSLNNNLEMKVKSKKDTITGTKKIVLIEDLKIGASYDIAKDSNNWSDLSMSGSTKLFKYLDIKYQMNWNPYAINDSTGNITKEFEYKKSKHFFRFDNTNWDIGLNWGLHSKTKKKEIVSNKATEDELETIKNNRDKYLDFDEPWNLNIQYSLNYIDAYSQAILKSKSNVIQTLGINGDINLSAKWKVVFFTGYDFINKELSYTHLEIDRDLHCWEMSFTWTPTGLQKSYLLTIRVKSAVLQDLKLTKKKDPWDN